MNNGPLDPASLAEDVERIARSAGEILLKYFDSLKPGQVQTKGSYRDLLSVADSEAEALVIDQVRQHFPGHSILGEENGFIEGTGEDYCWVIDPLDGTTNFVRSFPVFAVSIGVLYRGVPVAAAVQAPYLRETFVAGKGAGTYLNGERCAVSEVTEFEKTMLATGFSYIRNQVTRNNVDNFSNLILKVHDIRRAGAASMDLAYIACGRFDGYWEAYLNPWDVAAGGLLVQEAGGKVTDFSGQESCGSWLWQENTAASNGAIHGRLLEELTGTDPDHTPKFPDFAQRWE